MIVSPNDSSLKKRKWYFITLLLELLILFCFFGISFLIIAYHRIVGAILFFSGAFLVQKLLNCIENNIGISCCLQNPNRHNLVGPGIIYPPWMKKRLKAEEQTKPIKHTKRKPKIKKRNTVCANLRRHR